MINPAVPRTWHSSKKMTRSKNRKRFFTRTLWPQTICVSAKKNREASWRWCDKSNELGFWKAYAKDAAQTLMSSISGFHLDPFLILRAKMGCRPSFVWQKFLSSPAFKIKPTSARVSMKESSINLYAQVRHPVQSKHCSISNVVRSLAYNNFGCKKWAIFITIKLVPHLN